MALIAVCEKSEGYSEIWARGEWTRFQINGYTGVVLEGLYNSTVLVVYRLLLMECAVIYPRSGLVTG
jgi:hypothetical protein